MDNKKTALYIRLSDEDNNVDGIVKAESNSVSAQRILIRDYMQRNGLSNMADTLEYVDDGFSGTNFQRPAFQRMMDDAKQGKIGCIIVKDFSRFGRDHLETGNYLERIFPLLGIRFISVNDQFDSEDCMGMTGGMSVALKNIINSMYSRDLSKKVWYCYSHFPFHRQKKLNRIIKLTRSKNAYSLKFSFSDRCFSLLLSSHNGIIPNSFLEFSTYCFSPSKIPL